MKEQIKMIFFVVVLGIVAAAIMVGSQNYTSDRIAANKEYKLKSTILKAFEIDSTEDTLLQVYEKSIKEEVKGDSTFYYSEDGHIGFEIIGKGLWGPITGFMTLDSDLVTIKAIQIISNEETPGLGGVIAEQWYIDKYKGKKFDPEIVIKKGADMSSDTEIDSITGATMTSNAFQLMLNENYQKQKEVLSK